MIVKFIVTKDGNVYFGKRFFLNEAHKDIAFQYGVGKKTIQGGGLADFNTRRIYGTSYDYGQYDQEEVKKLLPDWNVEAPSLYRPSV